MSQIVNRHSFKIPFSSSIYFYGIGILIILVGIIVFIIGASHPTNSLGDSIFPFVLLLCIAFAGIPIYLGHLLKSRKIKKWKIAWIVVLLQAILFSYLLIPNLSIFSFILLLYSFINIIILRRIKPFYT